MKIYVWLTLVIFLSSFASPAHAKTRHTVASEKQIDAKLQEALVKKYSSDTKLEYRFTHVDLNHDTYPDAVVYLESREWCGNDGCVLNIFQGTKDGYQHIGHFPFSYPPIYITNTATKGNWETIYYNSGAGKLEALILRIDYQNQRYDQCYDTKEKKWEKCLGSKVSQSEVKGVCYFCNSN